MVFFAAWLSGWWFFYGLALGAVGLRCIHRLSDGAWGEALQPAIATLRQAMPRVLLLALPLLAGLPQLYPWAAHPPAGGWFAPAFVGLRLGAYALVGWWLARGDGGPRSSGGAAAWLLGWMLLGSLAAVDLLMSLTPDWASSIFGWLALTGQMTGGAAAAVALTALRGHRKEVSRDLGNLLLMFVMLQAYLQFMQFLIIWAENLPREIVWFLPRVRGGWGSVSIALAVLQFALPQLLLLWRSVKDEPRRLAAVALGLLAAQALGSAWLVLPSVDPQSHAGWWLLPLVFSGMGLVAFAPLARARTNREVAHGRS